jgi:hypothetical protein
VRQAAHRVERIDQLLERQVLICFTCISRSLTEAAPSSRMRKASVLRKNPIKGSSSVRVRPATGEPMTRSSWPLSLYSKAAQAASSVM